MNLNPNQQQAVTHNQGPILVIAGAGTGKTRVITERIAYILEQKWCTNDQILALTFTEKAAAEMEVRLDERMPIGYEAINVSTFHSFCEKTLRRFGMDIGISSGFKILEGVNQWKFIKEHLFEFDLNYYRPLGNPNKFIDALISHFSKVKEELKSPEDYLELAKERQSKASSDDEKMEADRLMELATAYQKYQSLLAENDYLDFTDLQYYLIRLFERRPNILSHLQEKYQYLLVDEYQDTNIAQNKIVDLLAAKHHNLMVVGDDDQSIYKFRGAAISNILQFEEKYSDAKKVVLTENYRSTQAILDFAYTSIQNNNPNRLEVKSNLVKKLTAQSKGDESSVQIIHCSTIDQEVNYVMEEIQKTDTPISNIAILCRANSYALPFIEAFKTHNIPYQFLSERGLYNKDEIKELIALLRLIANPTDDISLFKVLRMEWFNIQMSTILELIQQSKKGYATLWTAVQKSPECKHLVKLISDSIQFSKNHTVGEVLYQCVELMKVYETLLARSTIEAEEQIANIATFFAKIQRFERENEEKTVVDFIRYLDLAQEAGENPSAKFDVEGVEGVQITTIHGAKGLEFDTVFVPSLVSRRFPSDNRKDPIELPEEFVHEILSEGDFHLQEERRLFYVAVTRAKHKLHLIHSDFYSASNAQNPRPKKPSIFLTEVGDQVTVTKVEKTVEGVERFLKPKQMELEVARSEHRGSITRFSHSQLSTFERCPRQYQYASILKIPQPMSGAASFGSTLHNTLQVFYTIVEQGKQKSLFEEYDPDLSLDHLLQIYEDKWINVGFESKQHRDALKKRGQEILEKFHSHFKEEVTNIAFLEKGFKLKVGPYTLTGRIDRADKKSDGSLEIIDYKSGKSKSQKEVDNDQQLMIYAMAAEECFGIPATELTLYFLDEDIKVSTKPDAKKLEKMKEKIIQTADEINQSDFTPTPSKFKCQFCPYNKICDAAEV